MPVLEIASMIVLSTTYPSHNENQPLAVVPP